MRFRVRPGRFALLSIPRPRLVVALDALARLDLGGFGQVIAEPEGLTLLVPETRLRRAAKAAGTCRLERGFRVITFTPAMDWAVVGFLARVTGALARARVPVGVVCGFDLDHLFVRDRYLSRARAALRAALRGGS